MGVLEQFYDDHPDNCNHVQLGEALRQMAHAARAYPSFNSI